jgi:hypothetical protein
MVEVYAQLVLKIPLRGNPSCFMQKKAKLIAHEVPAPKGVCPSSPSSYVDLGESVG